MTTAEVASYWDRRPCNIRHSPHPVGSRTWSDEVERRKYFVEPHIPGFADFPAWRGKRVLEIGCGIGTDTLNFPRHGAEVTAVDISEQSLAIAADRARVHGLSNIWFVHSDAEKLGRMHHTKYDLIYSFGVLHHTPNPLAALRQFRLYAGPRTVLKIMLYHRWSWKFWLARQQPEAQAGCPVVHTYSRRSARRLLEAAGFRATNMKVAHIFPWRVRDYVEYHYVRAFPWNLVRGRLFRWLERRLGAHLLITAVPA